MAIAAFAAVAIVSCQKTEIAPSGYETVVLNFAAEKESMGLETKTAWNGSGVEWTQGDAISVTYTLDGGWASALYESAPLNKNAEAAEFKVPVSMPSGLKGSLMFHGIYPSSCLKGDFSMAPKVEVELPSVQRPSSDSFDPSADLMRAQAVQTFTSIPAVAIPLYWKRIVAHADVSMLMPPIPDNETVELVKFTSANGAELSGSYMLDLATRELMPKTAADNVTVMADRLTVKDGQMRLWMCLMPCHLTSLKVQVDTDKASYVKEIPSCDLVFKANVRGMLTVDMSSAARVAKTDPVKNALVNGRLFDVIDLDYPGLEDVKSNYLNGCIYEAAQALKTYYASRNDVSVPLVDLSSTRFTSAQKSIADQALKENGYRFYIASNYIESSSEAGDVYYSFLDTDGGVNWDFAPTTESMFRQHLHRHPWVANQALVYWGTKDEKYVKGIVDVYSDWLESHPCPVAGTDSYYMGMGHTSYRIWCNLQACARIETYIKVIQYCRGAESLTTEFLSDLLVSLYDCVECIRANYYYTDSGNIRQSETQAVLNMAVMMPEYKKSSEWLSEASSDTERMIGVLLMDDGVLVEKDPSYHIGVLSTFYEAYQVLAANGKASVLPSDYFSRLKGGVYFVRDLMYPDYSIEDFNDTRSSSWSKSVLKKNFLKYQEMFPDDATLQWFATERASGSAPDELLSLYKSAGWYMFRTGWNQSDMMLILKNNENSFGYAHCQNDNGTISLYRNGRHFLPDSGVYTYGGSDEDDALRLQFRQTNMHNTLTLNSANSVNNNKSSCGVFKNSAQTSDYDMVHTTNQSYGALRHERAVFRMKDGFFVVVDFGIGSATGSVELNWHMCPGEVTYNKHSNSYECRTMFADDNNMSFRTFCFNGTSLNSNFTAHAGTSYTSDLPGRKYERPCYDITVNKSSASTPVRFITVIYPFGDSSDLPAIDAMFNSASKITVTIGDKDYMLSL